MLEQATGVGALIDLPMHNPRASNHAAHITNKEHLAMTHRMAVVELPLDSHRDDLHVAVGMHPEATTGRDVVVANHSLRLETDPGRIEAVGKRIILPRKIWKTTSSHGISST